MVECQRAGAELGELYWQVHDILLERWYGPCTGCQHCRRLSRIVELLRNFEKWECVCYSHDPDEGPNPRWLGIPHDEVVAKKMWLEE